MALKTFSQLKTKLSSDVDLIDEPFLPAAELVGYMNEAIKDAETAIHNLGIAGGYFLTPAVIQLVANQQPYTPPPDIYANKIMAMWYRNAPASTDVSTTTVSADADVTVASATGLAVGQFVFGTGIPLYTRVIAISGTTVTLSQAATASATVTATFVSFGPVYGSQQYPIRKIRSLEDTMFGYPGNDYRYMFVNSQMEAGGNQILFYPTPTATGPFAHLWYTREVRELTSSTTDANNVLEIPECENFLYAHVKWNVALKSGRRIQERQQARDQQYTLMMETLHEMIPDADNQVLLDLSSYYNQEIDLVNF